jgi:hypothetical protein
MGGNMISTFQGASMPQSTFATWSKRLWLGLGLLLLTGLVSQAFAHGVAEGDKGYIQESSGVLFLPFVYLEGSLPQRAIEQQDAGRVPRVSRRLQLGAVRRCEELRLQGGKIGHRCTELSKVSSHCLIFPLLLKYGN